jgi:hypothetical protein
MAENNEEAEGAAGAGTSSEVYIMDKEYAWVPARLISQSGEKAVVSIPSYAEEAAILSDGGKGAKSWRDETISLKNYPGKTLPLQNINKDGVLNEVEDMVDLAFLHEVRRLPGSFWMSAWQYGLFLTQICILQSLHRLPFCIT